MATWSRILAWKVPWTEEPGGLQSVESQSQTWNECGAHVSSRIPLPQHRRWARTESVTKKWDCCYHQYPKMQKQIWNWVMSRSRERFEGHARQGLYYCE